MRFFKGVSCFACSLRAGGEEVSKKAKKLTAHYTLGASNDF